jgi:putative transposase
MGTFKAIPKEIKEQILKRIKEDGVSVADASREHGVSTKTIYNWMRNKGVQSTSILEISRLKRENKELLEIIGKLTHDLKRSKKIDKMRMIIQEKKRESKTQLAKQLGIARSSLYYKGRLDAVDEELRKQILVILGTHPSYGHKRIALSFPLSKKRVLRVMKKYGIMPYRRRTKKPRKKDDERKEATKWKNEIINLCPIRPNVVWASDFTYIKLQGRFIYLATIIDVYTREIIGWDISVRHDTQLVLGAIKHAIKRTGAVPVYTHSDQGSEYDAKEYEEYVLSKGIIMSMSHKNAPWENAFQESFYSQFKVDLGQVNRFETIEELVEEIYQTIYYYNNSRMHTSLKMSPVLFKQQYENRLQALRIPV